MLRSLKSLERFDILARDGKIGSVFDFFFDDSDWTLRYLVVTAGSWLSGRKVLVAPEALETPLWEQEKFPVSLTRKQVEDSPEIDTEKPVSREQQGLLHRYYGWALHWNIWAPKPGGESDDILAAMARKRFGGAGLDEPNLRSARDVQGYGLEAKDGVFGEVEDLIIDDKDWVIRYIVVDTGRWMPGRKVIISPDWVSEIDWSTNTVRVALFKEEVVKSPEYEPERVLNRRYEEILYEHYGRPEYWSDKWAA